MAKARRRCWRVSGRFLCRQGRLSMCRTLNQTGPPLAHQKLKDTHIIVQCSSVGQPSPGSSQKSITSKSHLSHAAFHAGQRGPDPPAGGRGRLHKRAIANPRRKKLINSETRSNSVYVEKLFSLMHIASVFGTRQIRHSGPPPTSAHQIPFITGFHSPANRVTDHRSPRSLAQSKVARLCFLVLRLGSKEPGIGIGIDVGSSVRFDYL